MKQFKVKVNLELIPLIPEFLANRWADRKHMELSIQNRDFVALADLGHLLQGTPGCFGFDYLVQLGKKVEKAARAKNLPQLKELQRSYEEFLQNHTIEASTNTKSTRHEKSH